MTEQERQDALERGHRYIDCRRCGFLGWSDDDGLCPRCWDERGPANEGDWTEQDDRDMEVRRLLRARRTGCCPDCGTHHAGRHCP